MNQIQQYRSLFDGRDDCWGGDEGKAIWQPVTDELVLGHLDGTQGIGIYPIRHGKDNELWVKWGCCDIDTGDWNEAYMLAVALKGMGLHPWIERSRSKGWHIWVFARSWVKARDMRRCLKVAYAAIDLPAREANPKSEVLRPEQLGNYVRLPFKGGAVDRLERQVMMSRWDARSDGIPIQLDEWLSFMSLEDTLADGATIVKWAHKWYEPPRKLEGVSIETIMDDATLAQLAQRLPADLRRVWQNGPKTADRSQTLQMIGYQCAKIGLAPTDTWQLVNAADRMWGKFQNRTNGDGYITDLVERSYR